MKDLAGLLNQSSLNILTFQLIDHYQKFLCRATHRIKKLKKRTNQHQK